MRDAHGRTIDYIRLSVTDRCDFRCVYCMSENMSFLPKKELLTLEELTTRVGMSVRNVRFYTSKGVGPPPTPSSRSGLAGARHASSLELVNLRW